MFVPKLAPLLITILITGFSLNGCSSSDSGGSNDGQINIANFEAALKPYQITVTNSTIIHEDGLQGATIDLDRILIGKTTDQNSVESLALGFSVRLTSAPPVGAFVALYIDVDNNALTGEPIAGIGADQMFFDGHVFNDNIMDLFSEYYFWTGTQWIAQANGSLASYYQGTQFKRAVVMPVSGTIAGNLFGAQDIKGVMVIRNYANSDPNSPGSIIDDTSVFTFSVPN